MVESVDLNTFPTADRAAAAAAAQIASLARAALGKQSCFTLAMSGGRSPWRMLSIFAGYDLDWSRIHFFQVDERIAPDGDPDRNHTQLIGCLSELRTLPAGNIHPLPVTATNHAQATLELAAELGELSGSPPVIDLVHLGIGSDGHTASLIPEDPVLDVVDQDLALTAEYQGRRRLTMTYPLINRARHILWLITGAEKTGMLTRLLRADPGIPAGRVSQQQARVFADRAAAAGIAHESPPR